MKLNSNIKLNILLYLLLFIYTENIEKALVDEETYVSERISALNVSLVNLDSSVPTIEDDNIEIDQFSNVSLKCFN